MLLFFVGVSVPVGVFTLVHKSKILAEAGFLDPSLINSDRGKISRESVLFSEIAKINFPGYGEILTQSTIPLSEESQFASPTQLLSNGDRINFNIPKFLPFQLTLIKAPKIIILGSSIARDGIRPDILQKELGVDSVLNLSLSGAKFSTIEVVIDHLIATQIKSLDLLIIAVNDISLFSDEGETERWRRLLKQFRNKQNLAGKLDSLATSLWNHLPHLRRNRISKLSQPFKLCSDKKFMQEKVKREKASNVVEDRQPDNKQIKAIRRILSKVEKISRRTVFLDIPTSSVHKWRMKDLPNRKIIKSVLGAELTPSDHADLKIEEWAFFGSKSLESCELDTVHMNPTAAIKFSLALAKILK